MASEKITAMIDEIKALSVLELKELVDEICETFGVSAVAAAAPAAGGAAEAVAEKTEFDVVMTSFGADKLYENYVALIGAINKAKPAAAKGQYIKSCVTASTMGPGIKINAQKQL